MKHNPYHRAYKKVLREVNNNPRQCQNCGCCETMDNLILKYDNEKYLCDDCAIAIFDEEV